ncbi:MAG: hypothetical protein ACOCQQ_02595 [Candidatus Nanoarchaeia archaeon]
MRLPALVFLTHLVLFLMWGNFTSLIIFILLLLTLLTMSMLLYQGQLLPATGMLVMNIFYKKVENFGKQKKNKKGKDIVKVGEEDGPGPNQDDSIDYAINDNNSIVYEPKELANQNNFDEEELQKVRETIVEMQEKQLFELEDNKIFTEEYLPDDEEEVGIVFESNVEKAEDSHIENGMTEEITDIQDKSTDIQEDAKAEDEGYNNYMPTFVENDEK